MRREPAGLNRGEGAELDKASCTGECEQAWEGPYNRTPGCLRTRFLPVGTVDLLVQIILVWTVLRAAGVGQPAWPVPPEHQQEPPPPSCNNQNVPSYHECFLGWGLGAGSSWLGRTASGECGPMSHRIFQLFKRNQKLSCKIFLWQVLLFV